MELVQGYLKWLFAVRNVSFRKRLTIGLFLLVSLVLVLPSFFRFAEERQGYKMNDLVLNALTPRDVSVPIFLCIWLTVVLFFFRSATDPQLFLLYIYGFLLICLCRMITISLVPLEPPVNLIELRDPLSNYFYGSKNFITKDLFFSGHTATLSLFGFCFKTKYYKAIALLASLAVACLLLVQHVHYTVDVIAAPFFSYGCFLIAKRIVNP
ncbi:MAG: phosphatase PAP2-related protein [Flavisolibacter sp.]